MSPKVSKERKFSGKIYVTDFKYYESKLEARAVVLFLKTKSFEVRARIIERKDYLIYYDKNTFKQIKYGKIKIPNYDDIPEDIRDMAVIGKKQPPSKPQKSDPPSKTENQEKRGEESITTLSASYMYGRQENYQVIQLDEKTSKAELMKRTTKKKAKKIKKTKKSEEEEEIEEGITVALEHIQNQFFDSCPKCGDDMKPKFLILGGDRRVSVYQCKTCRFFLPRNITFQY